VTSSPIMATIGGIHDLRISCEFVLEESRP
jgi:hypothetical protein